MESERMKMESIDNDVKVKSVGSGKCEMEKEILWVQGYM